jgi:hypothetical protein
MPDTKLRGVIAAIATPIDAAGSPDTTAHPPRGIINRPTETRKQNRYQRLRRHDPTRPLPSHHQTTLRLARSVSSVRNAG